MSVGFFSTMLVVYIALLLTKCEAREIAMNLTLPRDQELPLFQPHVPDFVCKHEAAVVPPIDAQADQWFREAMAFDSAEIYVDDKDYKSIVRLMRKAADRRHWKAMLNLASLYIERRDPGHDVRDAVKLVEEAMRFGVPAAYDRMGTYYLNGTGVPASATKAYAFMQRAAQMGNPDSMGFLAEKLRAGREGAWPGYWANIPVAIKMLECALAQGHGPSGEYLAVLYAAPGYAEQTTENKARAVSALHSGAKFACERCASELFIEFDHPISLNEMLVPHLDKARSERYLVFADAISFDPTDRFPNLDKVLPLPPAPLPPWNGNRDTLLNAARPVTLAPSVPSPSPASQRKGRFFLDAGYALRQTAETAQDKAPFEGYWQPTAPEQSEHVRKQVAAIAPGLYKKGEAFEPIYRPDDRRPIKHIVWQYHVTVPHDDGAVAPRAPKGMAREMPHSAPLRSAHATDKCPASGTWQPWLKRDHPLATLINIPARQAWLVKGQAFPHPQRDWHLPIAEQDLTWHLLDNSGPEVLDVELK